MNSQVLAASIGHSMSAGELPASTDAGSLAAVVLAVVKAWKPSGCLTTSSTPSGVLRRCVRSFAGAAGFNEETRLDPAVVGVSAA
jgi:hypothetical protein